MSCFGTLVTIISAQGTSIIKQIISSYFKPASNNSKELRQKVDEKCKTVISRMSKAQVRLKKALKIRHQSFTVRGNYVMNSFYQINCVSLKLMKAC